MAEPILIQTVGNTGVHKLHFVLVKTKKSLPIQGRPSLTRSETRSSRIAFPPSSGEKQPGLPMGVSGAQDGADFVSGDQV